MKTIFKINQFAFIISMIFIFFFSGCGEYLNNPLEDKETGKDINLLVVDFNFFNTRMSYKLKDATTGDIITKNARVKFVGKNATDIVSFSGKKNAEYQTAEGQLELTIDPNIDISSNTPFEFAITVEIEGYNTLNQGIQIQSEGIKTYELILSKIDDEEETDLTGNIDFEGGDTTFYFFVQPIGFKSANIDNQQYTIKHSFSMSDLLKFRDQNGNPIFNSKDEAMGAYVSDPENFIKVTVSKYTDYQPGIDVVDIGGNVKSALFHKLETGKITKLIIDGKKVVALDGGAITSLANNADDFLPLKMGFVSFENHYWKMLGNTVSNTTVESSYTLATVLEEDLCSTGSNITFKSDTVISSFSIDADVFDEDGKFVTSMNFKGMFPETFVAENVPSKAVKLVFRNNNPGFVEIPPLEIANLCTGDYEINVSPVSNYIEYQIVLKALCPNNLQVAIAPTYSAEVKIKDSNNNWQGVNMKGGVVDILGLPDNEYEIRLLWDQEWEYSTYFTKFDSNGKYLGTPKEDTKITSRKLSDGRIQINVERIFKQNICDDMGW